MGRCPNKSPSLTKKTDFTRPECKGGKSRRRMASEQQINRLPGLLAVEMIREQALPTDSHTSPKPPPTNGGSDEFKPNTAD